MGDIRKVAELAKVSTGTVSNAFKRPDKVSDETRRRIFQVAREVNYYPNQLASALVTSHTNLIGLLVSRSFSINRGRAINEFFHRASQLGYMVMFGVAEMNQEEEESVIRRFIQYRVDGVIVYADYSEDLAEHFCILADNHIPTIVVKRHCDAVENIAVEADDALRAMMAQVARYKHRKAGAIFMSPVYVNGVSVGVRAKRAELYEKYAGENHIGLSKKDILFVSSATPEEGERAVDSMLAADLDFPTVLFCMNDHVAVGAMKRLQERGFRIPEDVSVIGYGNHEISSFVVPALATVDPGESEILKHAWEMLLQKMAHPEEKVGDYTAQHCFILRGSLGPAPKKIETF